MEIRKGTYKDLNSLMKVFDGAKQIMRSCGNLNQWNNGYPSLDTVSKDIESGHCIVACEGDAILATMSLIPGPDITYSSIEGRWIYDDPYYVIHRIATATSGRKIAPQLFDWAFEHIRQIGLNTIRIDTHRDNCIMKHILTKYGFNECGVIYLENGDPRDAYIMKKEVTIRTEQYYRHFKGNIYRILHIAKHTETLEDMVVYQAMYGERGIWVRPKRMFDEVIERDGQSIRRFAPISAEEAEKVINML